ncbi:FecCD family ABC transporter permease [Williamsia sterculiae]|uniref:Iron complex transport system permease protein n=1 Tax=Williamsia sterculiae TaxID=1344003 RepID=A0A1N7CFA1_9NOCA|nr:iron chelate uptake ABC transporter family permease subunit [Williamsia sterculiae]SIR62193.1 iron complex transport system permease protein [Williamsia sterculiae]
MTARSSDAVDFGRRLLTVRTASRLSARVDLRTVLVVALLVLAAAAISVVALGSGDFPIAPGRVLAALVGHGDEAESLVVLHWRLPRVLMAFVLGWALGISGAIFQSLTRNPLGSPDIIGFNTGAYTGALIVILTLNQTSYYAIGGGALIGGVATALAVYLLAFKRGVQGFRLIIVGIGISAVLASVNTWLILKANLANAMSASTWGAGTLNGIVWDQARPALIGAAVLSVGVAFAAHRMPVLAMGDDTAQALGVRAEPTRLTMIVIAVALTALSTAVAGPIAFVALAAPQLARVLTRSAGVTLLPAGAMGAVILTAGDLIAARTFSARLPVGVITVAIGGLYLIWLLAREARRQ